MAGFFFSSGVKFGPYSGSGGDRPFGVLNRSRLDLHCAGPLFFLWLAPFSFDGVLVISKVDFNILDFFSS